MAINCRHLADVLYVRLDVIENQEKSQKNCTEPIRCQRLAGGANGIFKGLSLQILRHNSNNHLQHKE
jgi:hypothetical protein